VTSTGVFGRRLDNVDIVVRYENGGEERTRTDLDGRYGLCPLRHDAGVLGSALLGTNQYSGPHVRGMVTFSRSGWATKSLEVTFDGDSVDKTLDVLMSRTP
jgi:hypothetical protein